MTTPAGKAERFEEFTELGNARRFVALFGGRVRFVPGWGWLFWDGKRWHRDETGEVMRYAKMLPTALYDEARRASEGGKPGLADAAAQWARQSQSAARLTATLKLTETEGPIVALPGAFDRMPLALNTPSGTLYLDSGLLASHEPLDMLTMITRVPYDPDASCPIWHGFLERILPDPELRAFVQRAVGYSLTGATCEQVMFFLHGAGRNGKSMFLNALSCAIGEYASIAAASTFMLKPQGDSATNDLAALRGARFVVAVETEEGHKLAESLIKRVTGQDPITVRLLYREPFTYTPTWKLWLAANHKPTVRGTDLAIWRRLQLIPFTITIPEEQVDRNLPEKLAAEASGILAWAVTGCMAWQEHGLKPPQAVRMATADYREGQDTVGIFLNDCCVQTPMARLTKADLFTTYLAWCDTYRERPLSHRSFAQRLKERDFGEHRGAAGQQWWLGIGLLGDPHGSDGSDRSSPFSHNFSSLASREEDLGKNQSLQSLQSLNGNHSTASDPHAHAQPGAGVAAYPWAEGGAP